MTLAVRQVGGEVVFEVRVAPRASRDAIGGEHGGALKVSVTAPPVGGAANGAVCALLAKALGVAKGRVRVVRGETSKRKQVAVEGVEPGAIEALLSNP